MTWSIVNDREKVADSCESDYPPLNLIDSYFHKLQRNNCNKRNENNQVKEMKTKLKENVKGTTNFITNSLETY